MTLAEKLAVIHGLIASGQALPAAAAFSQFVKEDCGDENGDVLLSDGEALDLALDILDAVVSSNQQGEKP